MFVEVRSGALSVTLAAPDCQTPTAMRAPITAILFPILFLAACGSYEPPDPGLIANPTFAPEDDAERVGAPWFASQHAGGRSFDTSVSDGVLTIERIGTEPWGHTIQSVPAEELQGRRVEFSVELAGSLQPVDKASETGKTLKGYHDTGLGAVVKGYRDDPRLRRLLGKTTLETVKSEEPLEPGEHDWRRHRLVFDVPENATEIEVQIRLTHNGVLKARGPRLVALDESDESPGTDDQGD